MAEQVRNLCAMQQSGDTGLIPRWGRSPGKGKGNPLQYSCLENPINREAWQDKIYRVAKSQTGKELEFLKNSCFGSKKNSSKKMLFILIPDQLKVFWDQDLGMYPIKRSCNRHPFGPVHSFPVSQSTPWLERLEDSPVDTEFTIWAQYGRFVFSVDLGMQCVSPQRFVELLYFYELFNMKEWIIKLSLYTVKG